LGALGWSSSDVRRQVEAGRWRMAGAAVVLHTGSLNRAEVEQVALVNCGPRAILTSFTALQSLGLSGWTRDGVHVLAPAGARRPVALDIPVVLHRTSALRPSDALPGRRCHRPGPAAILAASSFPSPRPGCGLLAAVVQQRLATPAHLRVALAAAPRTRHRASLLAAIGDIGMGAQALSEIDFVRLCRRHALPRPAQQSARVEPTGRRRYLDAEWSRRDGRRVAAEVDGAVHLAPRRWWDDQLRQNELTLSGTLVLRFPSVIVRTEPALVAGQLRRALFA
jgi:hypothetical protein